MTLALCGVDFAVDMGWGCNLGFDPTALPEHSHLWFVRALMLAVAVSPIFLPLRKRIFGAFCLLAFVILCECLRAWLMDGVQDWKRAFAIGGWFRGLSFFSIGVYLRSNPVKFSRWCVWRSTGWGYVCLALAFLPWLFKALLLRHGFEMVVHKIELPILLMSVYFLFKAVPDNPWPKWLTACAFPIYLIHGAVLILFVAACRAVGLKDYLLHCSAAFYILYWAAAVGVSIAATLLLRRIRWLSSIAFGGR